MLTLESAHSPSYAAEDGSCISLMVKFAEFDQELPFGATPHDPHDHGRNIYERALAGEFGEIAPFVSVTTQAGENQPSTQGSQDL
jgi:hypothetical protein